MAQGPLPARQRAGAEYIDWDLRAGGQDSAATAVDWDAPRGGVGKDAAESVKAQCAEIQRSLAAEALRLAAPLAVTTVAMAEAERGGAALFPVRTVSIIGDVSSILAHPRALV